MMAYLAGIESLGECSMADKYKSGLLLRQSQHANRVSCFNTTRLAHS